MNRYTFTIQAVFLADTQQEAWDEWVEWLTDPGHLEDGTVVGDVSINRTAFVEALTNHTRAYSEALTERVEAQDDTDLRGDEGQDRESYTDDQDRDEYTVDEDAQRGDR